MPSHKYTGIILRRTNLGEADRIVTAFSKESGKVKFVAKGARRTKSKLAGGIELFCKTNLMINDGKNLDILTSSEIVKNYLGLKPNLEKLKLASFIAEVINKLTLDNNPNSEIFSLADSVLNRILEVDEARLKIYFITNFLSLSGILPELSECVKCNEKPSHNIYFSQTANGILDEDCSKYFDDAQDITLNAVKLIRASSGLSIDDFRKISVDEKYLEEACNLLVHYLVFSFDRSFKSELI
jgi:DNA repair protein RecO (recombination protein O)